MPAAEPDFTDDDAGDRDAVAAYRLRPHNSEVEQALLGALLINNEALHRITGFLQAEHFYEPVHGRIYDAIYRFVERGQIANAVTLKPQFDADEALADVGGGDYLARLMGAAISIINVEDYARTIHDLALKRALIDIGEEVVNRAYDETRDERAVDQIEQAEQKLFHLAEQGQVEGGFTSFGNALATALNQIEAAYKRDGNLVGVATGLVDLDNLLGGLQPSDLIILAGRPSMGKTALATTIAFNAARAYREETDENGERKPVDGAVVGFFSLEMSAEQLAGACCRIGRDSVRPPAPGHADQRGLPEGSACQPGTCRHSALYRRHAGDHDCRAALTRTAAEAAARPVAAGS